MKTILSFNKFFLTFLSLCFLITNLSSQNLTQTIRGKVIDKNTRVCLIGANVVLLDSDPLRGSTTDIDGKFKIENVPIGRVGIKVSYLGYSDVILNNLDLASAKELIFNIELEEKIYVGKEAVISGSRDKSAPINRMTTVSTRGFTVEETKRYAGSRNDVARMAANYAGVRGVSDDRNDIIIRGNSPTGLLWRLEGVDIPNPNHYGALGTTGGPVSILNNNLLDNSDFMTAAFPAEYGNALSGVFDIKMRNGNNENHEFLGQVGFNGFEIGAEGPISRKNDASYIINYRYSTLEAFDALGVDFGTGTAIPKYQDIALKINFPKTKLGSFSLFGIGGISDISMLESDKDTTKEGTNFYMGEGFDLINGSDMAVVGLTHMYLINPTTYTKFIISGSMHNFTTQIDSIVPDIFEILPWYRNNFTERKIFTSFFINKKLSSQHSIKTGVIFNILNFNLTDSVFNDNKGKFDILTDYDGTTYLLQPYAQWKYKITEALTLNAGIHYQYLFLNNTNSLEPRLGFKWKVSSNKTISIGFGKHSQLLPVTAYFNQVPLPDGSYHRPNEHLNFIRSYHYVVAYDWNISENLRLKSEIYFQNITDAAVDSSEMNSYSIINEGANFYVSTPDTLMNKGTGVNYGIEFTLERFLNKGMYFLLTTSLYESKYQGSDDIQRNSAFNGNYVINALFGKEYQLGKKKGNKKRQYVFSFDIKANLAGGQRYIPIIPVQVGPETYYAEYDYDNAYSEKYKDYSRVDLKIALRQNNKKTTLEWAIDFQNLFNSKNIYNQVFNTRTGEVSYTYQLGLLIIPQFRIEF